VFLGPTGDQMRALGLKHTAREIALREGAPLLPGTDLLADQKRPGARPSAVATR
jgi:urea carboxylase